MPTSIIVCVLDNWSDKPIPKNQRLNVFPDKWMMIYNGVEGGGLEKNGGTLYYIEGMKDGGMRQASLPYLQV